MGLGATAIGALLGLSIRMYSNALRKLCHPCDLVLGMGLGAVAANHVAKGDDQDLQHRAEMLTKLEAAAIEYRFIDDYDD